MIAFGPAREELWEPDECPGKNTRTNPGMKKVTMRKVTDAALLAYIKDSVETDLRHVDRLELGSKFSPAVKELVRRVERGELKVPSLDEVRRTVLQVANNLFEERFSGDESTHGHCHTASLELQRRLKYMGITTTVRNYGGVGPNNHYWLETPVGHLQMTPIVSLTDEPPTPEHGT